MTQFSDRGGKAVAGLALCILTLGALLPAQAQAPAPARTPQPPAPAPAAVPSEPQATTATFGDWVMRCVRQAEPTPKICEVVLTLQVQGQPGPLAQIAVGRLQRNAPMRMTAVLPVNITLPSTVRVLTAANDPQPLELTWKRCIQGACIADLELTAPNLQKLRGRSEAGQITLVDAAGRELALPLSMRGLVQALDAVNREMN